MYALASTLETSAFRFPSAHTFLLPPLPPLPQATVMHFLLPCMLAVYLGIILQGYSVKEFNGLITNRYFLLGKEGGKEGWVGGEGGKEGWEGGGDTCPTSTRLIQPDPRKETHHNLSLFSLPPFFPPSLPPSLPRLRQRRGPEKGFGGQYPR